MRYKTIFEQCLEISEKATPGQWYEVDGERILVCLAQLPPDADGRLADVYDPSTSDLRGNRQSRDNATFIAFSRTAIPELVRRLKLTCNELRRQTGQYDTPLFDDFLKEIEEPFSV